MSSDKKKVAKKRGNVMSSVLVVAALAAAGGGGYFLWNYQARLDQPAPEPVAAAAPLPDPVEPKKPEAWVTELLPASPPPAAAHKAVKPIRGDIKIVGRNGTTASVAPPTAEDLAAAARNGNTYNGPPVVYNTGPQVFKPEDPNRYQPQDTYRSGRPRYYDFESNRARVDDYDPTFQRRTTVKQSN